MSSLDPNDGLTDAELIAGGKKYSGAGLPMGFVQGSDGIVYKQVNGKLVVASPEEARAAAAAERASTAGAVVTPANKQIITDDRTGEALVVDPRTGAITRTGQQVGFAGVDPRETAAAKEQAAAAERQLTGRQQAIDLLKQSQNALMHASDAAEAAVMDRAKLKSAEAIANAQIKEQARQADLRAAVDQYQTAMSLIPALGQLSIDESKRVQDIFANGQDFLARAFESRGGTSPLAKVMQADQINALGSSIGQLRSMVNDAVAQSPVAKGGGFQPIQGTVVDGYTAADLTRASSTGLPGGSPGVAPISDSGGFKYSAAPAIQPVAATAPAVSSGGGGFGGAAIAAPANISTISPETSARMIDAETAANSMPAAPVPAPSDTSAADIPRTGWAPDVPQLSKPTPPVVNQPGLIDDIKNGRFTWSAGNGLEYHAGGGFTQAAQMVVGDSRSGKPTGHEEIVVNPTGAPLAVIPNERAQGFMRAMPRYATGTGADVAVGNATQHYDWYDPMTGEAGNGAFNPGTPGEMAPVGGFVTAAAPVAAAPKPAYTPITQADIVRMAQENAPPAVRAVMNGQAVPARTSLQSVVDPSKYLRPMTSRQLNSLDPEELKALGTATTAEFNAPLSYITGQTARQYGPSQQRRSGFAGAAGL